MPDQFYDASGRTSGLLCARLRLLSIVACVAFVCPMASSSTALLHSPRKSVLVPSAVTAFGGTVEVTATPIKPDTSLTVVWLLDTLDAPARDVAHADLLALYAQARGRPLRLALLHGGAVELRGPFASRTQIERVFASIDSSAGGADAAPALLDVLTSNLAQLGSKWSPVLLVGKLPNLDQAGRAYAQALLSQSFVKQQLRTFLLAPAGRDDTWSPAFEASGGAVIASTDALPPLLDEISQAFLQVTWPSTEPPGGFIISSAVILDSQANPLATVPDLVTAQNSMPTIEKYDWMKQQIAPVAAWLRGPTSPEIIKNIRDALLVAQEINPIDPAVLRAETTLGELNHDYPYAVKTATMLTQVDPADGTSFATLGKALVLASEFDKAETALNSATALNVPPEQLAELYAYVHVGRKDEIGSLPYLKSALAADSKRQDLWLLQAQIANHLNDTALAIRSYEQGLSLGGVHPRESASLLHLYLDVKQQTKAHDFALHTVETLPPDPEVRTQFAEMLDQAELPAEALAAWKSVLAVQPASERGHVRVSQLLLQVGDAKGAEDAADFSLQNLPKSGGLFMAKSNAILQQGRIYDARSILEEGAAGTQDPAVLTRLATMQEAYGDRAPDAYANLANMLGKGSQERLHALERGFSLSLRDGNLKQSASFAAMLDSDGHAEYRELLGEKRAPGNDALVPGGLEAFEVIANMKHGIPTERFFAEYARQLVTSVCTKNCGGDRYSAAIQSYFTTIASLQALGKRNGNHVTLSISIKNKDDRNNAQNILKLLGLQMHTEKGQLRLDRGEKQSAGKQQDILLALGVDEVGLQEAMQAGKAFEFEIRDEFAPIYPSAKMWKDSFPKLDQSQFALMLLHAPLMARLYVGMSTLDRRTVQALIGTSGLYYFTGHPADMLLLYGNSFATERSNAAVPGGIPAEPVWSQMVGVGTDKPGPFYQALLDPKNATLLTYFYTISHLDRQHQAFFTANLARAKRFYALFLTLPESHPYYSGALHDSSFSELLSSVPIDDQGHVAFPGSPELWMVVKGSNADDKRVAKMMKKVSKAASPDLEDEILLHLADTRYKSHSVISNELDNFLSVARIDAHRADPMDEESALLLAQHYSEFSSAYPYFADLTAVDAAGFRSFFALGDNLGRQPLLEQQLELGQLNSLVEWVVLMKRRRVIEDSEAARLFTLICTRLNAANDEAARTQASIDLVQTILGDCKQPATQRWDETLRTCLLGQSANRTDQRGRDYQIILSEQKAPALETVRVIVAAAKASLTPSVAGHAITITLDKAALPSVALPSNVKVTGKEKDAVLLYDPARLQKVIDDWNLNAAKPQNAKTAQAAQKLAGELLKEVEPQITLALAAPVYAYFFRSSDVVISDDPLLLRKHRFFDFVSAGPHHLTHDSEFSASSEGLGSHLEGGFAKFGLASAFAAASGWRQGGQGGSAVVAEQIAAIRSATWELLLEADQRLVTLRILAAREWIVAAARNPGLYTSLSEETSGLLSLSRRADLLNSIDERDWLQVWSSITLPDLFHLGGSYLQRYPATPSESLVVTQLRSISASNDGTRLNILGRIPTNVLGCSHTHLASDAPYEEYERQLQPRYLAERTSEFKLFLAYRADSLGVQPADLPQVAEKLAAKAFSNSHMTDFHDWRSLLTAYASITNDHLRSALEP